MWLKRKKRKNRRFERKRILDVKLRSSHRRKAWLRKIVLTLGIAISVCCGIVLAWRGSDWLMRQLVYENRAFAIHNLDIDTDGVIPLEHLRQLAGVRLDYNLFALDLSRVKRDLELVPSIESVSVERILPHTLRIRVKEREPVAQVIVPQSRADASGHGVYFFDPNGYVMFPLRHLESSEFLMPGDERLPELVGLSPTELLPGRPVSSPQARAALRLLVAFERSPMAGLVEIKQVAITNGGVLQVLTADRAEILFGFTDMDAQLRRWRTIHDFGKRTGHQLAWLDLSVSNNLPARWLEAGIAPANEPKPAAPTRHRKKNV